MKTFLFMLLFLIMLLGGCHKKHDVPEASLCPLSDTVRADYTESALQLLMQQYLNNTTLSGYHNAVLSGQERDEMLGYIQSVFNLSIPERDSIFDVYGIKAFPVVSLYDVVLKVDPSAPEVKQLIAGKPSGNLQLENVLARYALDSIKPLSSYPYFNWIVVHTATPHNMIQVAKELSGFPFIYVAEADSYGGDGDRIVFTRYRKYVELDFSIGRGDCPSGCIYRRHWVFRVSGCAGSFVTSY